MIAATDTPHVLSAAFVYELPFGRGKALPEHRAAVANGLRRRLADEHHLQVLVRPAVVLPVGLLQRAGRVPCGLHPGDHQPGRRLRAGQGQFRSGLGPLFNKDAFDAGQRLQLLLRQRQPRRGERPRLRLSRTRTSRSSRTPGWRAARTSSSGSRCSTCGTGTSFQPTVSGATRRSTPTSPARTSAGGIGNVTRTAHRSSSAVRFEF